MNDEVIRFKRASDEVRQAVVNVSQEHGISYTVFEATMLDLYNQVRAAASEEQAVFLRECGNTTLDEHEGVVDE